MEQARTELLFGEHLRRERRRADARPHLRAALETFQRLGMPVWADRACDELRATGEATGDPATDTLAQLTPQELRIAAAVGEGATNREVAAQLFLSPRTVDYHLRKVFQKLRISSRADLIRLVASDARQSKRAR
jgi:DNA-binding CsgD family transcriptional regulator